VSSKYRTFNRAHDRLRSHDMRGVFYWTCARCGKRSFKSRRDAKEIARLLFPGRRMRYYKCADDSWHFTSSLDRSPYRA
jgi:ribosomal protein L37E